MRPVTHQNLGVAIAYLIPGFGVLWTLSLYSPTLRSWLGASTENAPTIGGFLYVTVGSLGLGILFNMLRALVLDPLHHRTGIEKRDWSYAVLQQNIAAIEFLVVHQFRYYQFSGNMLVAGIFAYAAFEFHAPGWSAWLFLGAVAGEVLLWFGSRATLRTYYRRLGEILGQKPAEEDERRSPDQSDLPAEEPSEGSRSHPPDRVGSAAAA